MVNVAALVGLWQVWIRVVVILVGDGLRTRNAEVRREQCVARLKALTSFSRAWGCPLVCVINRVRRVVCVGWSLIRTRDAEVRREQCVARLRALTSFFSVWGCPLVCVINHVRCLCMDWFLW